MASLTKGAELHTTHKHGVEPSISKQRRAEVKKGIRHSVYYSIIASEWPAVKAQLQDKLQRV